MITSRPSEINGEKALLSAGFLFGASSPMARYVGSFSNPYTTALIRFGLSVPLLLYAARNEKHTVKSIVHLVPIAFVGALSPFLFTLSLFYTKISLAIFFFYAFNLMSSIIAGRVLYNETLSGRRVIAFSLGLIGLFAMTHPWEDFSVSLGAILATLSGLVATGTYLLQKNIGHTYSPQMIGCSQAIAGTLLCLPLVILHGFAIQASLVFMIVSIIYAGMNAGIIYLLSYGFRRADLGVGTLLTSTELIFGPLFAFLFFQETLTYFELCGGVLVALATIISAVRFSNTKATP